LKEKKKNLEEKFKQNLMKIKEELSQNFKYYEMNSLKQLKQELIQEMDLPKNSKEHLLRWITFPISSINSELSKDIKGHANALRINLSRIGMTEERYFELMDKNEIEPI
jgi:hypothetical protein